MFTGIIEATARVQESGNGILVIERPKTFDDLRIGSSIAVAGVCLSVVKLNKNCIQFEVVPETLQKTTLGSYKEGDTVNLERAMKVDARLDGHIVQGHVEGVGEVRSVSTSSPRPPPPSEGRELLGKQWGASRVLPSNTKFFAREMRREPTAAESLLWDRIRRDRLGVRMRRQYVLDGQILDFYCPALKFAIEVDGGIHSEHLQKKSDTERDRYLLEEHGITTIRISNDRVFGDADVVVKDLLAYIQNITQQTSPSSEGGGVRGGGLHMSIPRNLFPFIVPKGSIALDGVSLTVASIEEDCISVALIPHTLENTTLGRLQKGDRVNIETDVLVRYAVKNRS